MARRRKPRDEDASPYTAERPFFQGDRWAFGSDQLQDMIVKTLLQAGAIDGLDSLVFTWELVDGDVKVSAIAHRAKA